MKVAPLAPPDSWRDGPLAAGPVELRDLDVVAVELGPEDDGSDGGDGGDALGAVAAALGATVHWVLHDRRTSPGALRAPDGLPAPLAVVAADRRVAAIARAIWRCRAWTTSGHVPPRRTGGSVLVVAGAEPSAEEELALEVLLRHRAAVHATGPGAARVLGRLGVTDESCLERDPLRALRDRPSAAAVILDHVIAGADVAAALGHAVVSERAPVLCDHRFVATVLAPEGRVDTAITLDDVVADRALAAWIGDAGHASVLGRVHAATATDAHRAAAGHAWLRALGDAVLPRYGALLAPGDLRAELARVQAAEDLPGWWSLPGGASRTAPS